MANTQNVSKVRTVVEGDPERGRPTFQLMQQYNELPLAIEVDELSDGLFLLTLADPDRPQQRSNIFLDAVQLHQVADTIEAFFAEHKRSSVMIRIPVAFEGGVGSGFSPGLVR